MKNCILIVIAFSLFACNQQEEGKNRVLPEISNTEEYLVKGNELTAQSFLKLSTVLKAKMKEGGVHEAIYYCNKSAYFLIDSISSANGVAIKRVAIKYRNPANQPDSLEKAVLNNYQQAIDNNRPIAPMVYSSGSENRYFAPILTKGLCLSCHGTPGKHISESDYQFIKEKYPNDKAIKFESGDLRGIWSIRY